MNLIERNLYEAALEIGVGALDDRQPIEQENLKAAALKFATSQLKEKVKEKLQLLQLFVPLNLLEMFFKTDDTQENERCSRVHSEFGQCFRSKHSDGWHSGMNADQKISSWYDGRGSIEHAQENCPQCKKKEKHP